MEAEMADKNVDCYGKLAEELLTTISQVYWGRMYKFVKENNIDYKDINCFLMIRTVWLFTLARHLLL